VGRDQLIFGNGSNEVLELVAHVFLGPGGEAVMGVHGFAVYKLVTLLMGAKAVEVAMPRIGPRSRGHARRGHAAHPCGFSGESEQSDRHRPSPGRVGWILPVVCLRRAVSYFDEAYTRVSGAGAGLPSVGSPRAGRYCARGRFSKIYGLAGLRLDMLYPARHCGAAAARARAVQYQCGGAGGGDRGA